MAETEFQHYFKYFVRRLPVFQAFFRAIEAECLAGFKPIPAVAKILDLGCGDGTFTQIFLGAKRQIVGVDIDREALNEAKKKGIYQRLVKAEAARLPFKREEFDLVFANSCLEHMDQLETVLAQLARVLKKNGRLLLSAPSEKREAFFLGHRFLAALGLKKAAMKVGQWQNHLVDHRTCWSGQQWRRALKAAGFKKVNCCYCGSAKSCALADWLMILSFPAWLEVRLFGRYLAWRKISGPVFYFLLKNLKEKVNNKQGAILAVEAVK